MARSYSSFRTRAFTILELTTVILLILIVASIFTPFLKKAITSSYRVRCVSNLRNLHVAFEGYLQDHKMWPGQPDYSADEDRNYEDWWLAVMAPYTSSSTKIWQCPLLASQHLKNLDGQLMKLHYTPTMFDAKPLSPHRWPTQPWITEITNAHGKGSLMLMPDGSVINFSDIVTFTAKPHP
ncbi:MAG: type II secretion system protein [Chthoniobacterales bacterium]